MEQKYWTVWFTGFCDYYHSVVVKADNFFEAGEIVRNDKRHHCTLIDKVEPASEWEIAQYNFIEGLKLPS